MSPFNIRESKVGDLSYDNDYELLIDGDMVLYGSAWATNNTDFAQAQMSVVFTLYRLFDLLSSNNYTLYMSSRFNHRRAIWPLYKANRSGKEKPVHFEALRKFMVETFNVREVEGYEADDLIAERHRSDKTIVVSNDKDFDQLVGFHMPLSKSKGGLYWVNTEDAAIFSATQLLTGDRIDNIPGLSEKAPKRGIGKVGALKILTPWEGSEKALETILGKYREKYGDDAELMMQMNAYLLYLGANGEFLGKWRAKILEMV